MEHGTFPLPGISHLICMQANETTGVLQLTIISKGGILKRKN